jgi:hypothetical protein
MHEMKRSGLDFLLSSWSAAQAMSVDAQIAKIKQIDVAVPPHPLTCSVWIVV